MDDDLNTADALGAIFELVKDANVSIGGTSSRAAAEEALKSLKALCGVLGFLTKEEDELPAEISEMMKEREEARKNRDWKRSDELRDAIRNDTVRRIFSARVKTEAEVKRERVAEGINATTAGDGTVKKQPRKVKKIGRNDPCPCGSGKKYKQCCGR